MFRPAKSSLRISASRAHASSTRKAGVSTRPQFGPEDGAGAEAGERRVRRGQILSRVGKWRSQGSAFALQWAAALDLGWLWVLPSLGRFGRMHWMAVLLQVYLATRSFLAWLPGCLAAQLSVCQAGYLPVCCLPGYLSLHLGPWHDLPHSKRPRLCTQEDAPPVASQLASRLGSQPESMTGTYPG